MMTHALSFKLEPALRLSVKDKRTNTLLKLLIEKPGAPDNVTQQCRLTPNLIKTWSCSTMLTPPNLKQKNM
jgi:hypothetical protein